MRDSKSLNHTGIRVAFDNFDRLIRGDILDNVSLVRGWPIDFKLNHYGGLANTNVLAKRVRTETAATPNVPINGSLFLSFSNTSMNACANG